MTTPQEQFNYTMGLVRERRDQLGSLLRQMEQTWAILNRPLESPNGEQRRTSGRKTAKEHLVEVLRDLNNKPTDYHDLASMLVDRGYNGNVRPTDVIGSVEHRERIAHSISGTLSNNKDVFKGFGGGVWALLNFESPR